MDTTPIETKRLILRRYKAEDLNDLFLTGHTGERVMQKKAAMPLFNLRFRMESTEYLQNVIHVMKIHGNYWKQLAFNERLI